MIELYQRWNRSWSDFGRPSMSTITLIGKRVVNWSTRSTRPSWRNAVDEVAGVLCDDRDELLGELAAAEGRRDQAAVHGVLAAVHLQDRAAVHRLELPA